MLEDVELYGSQGCPYTSELREHLLWEGKTFAEYDVEADQAALVRMLERTGGQRTVPVLVEGGRVAEIGGEAEVAWSLPRATNNRRGITCPCGWSRQPTRRLRARSIADSPGKSLMRSSSSVREATNTAALSGGVFQNELLLADTAAGLGSTRVQLWTNREVPPNDGGISLGQAELSLDGSGR